jgi:prolyl oligopeptidase
MKHIKEINWLIFILLLTINVACVRDMKVTYPETMKIDHIDIYFNDTIVDPYQWLENIHSDTVATWIKNQNELTLDYLSKISFREKIRRDVTKIKNTPATVYSLYGNKYYLTQLWHEPDSIVIYETDNLKDKARVLVNIGELVDIDSIKHVVGFCMSPDNRYFAYMYTLPQDSGWTKIRIRDIKNNATLPDTINIMPYNYKWMDWNDGNLYYYTRPKGKKWGIYCHKPYTAQESDNLVQPYCTNMRYSSDKRYLFFTSGKNNDKLNIKLLENPDSKAVRIDSFKLQRYSKNWQSIQNHSDDIYMFCNQNPLQNKLMKVNIAANQQIWETVIPENEDILTDFYIVKDKIVAHYLHNANSRLFVFDLDGKNKTELPLPAEFGSVERIRVHEEGFIFLFSSFVFPPTHYHIANITEPKLELLQSAMPDFNAKKYTTEQVWYTSKDGTKIPIFLTSKKGLQRNGKNPVLLNGYGGFGISKTPFFNRTLCLFVEKGGVFALANIRGGGELGEKWHEAGMKLNKQNVFDDFIAAAEYLIRENYTSPEKLALDGGSNGGLLLSACLVQRPELFKVVTAHRSVTDMLKNQKWEHEYGSCKNIEEYRYLREYSPLHNVKENVHYPATLITTGIKDDNVPPWHSFKFAATVQNAQTGENPVLIRTDSIAGHSYTGIDEIVDWLSFLFTNLEMKY